MVLTLDLCALLRIFLISLSKSRGSSRDERSKRTDLMMGGGASRGAFGEAAGSLWRAVDNKVPAAAGPVIRNALTTNVLKVLVI